MELLPKVVHNSLPILRDFVEEQGGEVLTRHKVDKIVVEKGKVTGVRRGENTLKPHSCC